MKRQHETDAILIPVLEDDFHNELLLAADAALEGRIQSFLNLGDFKGKPKTTSVLYTNGGITAPRIILVGLGMYSELNAEKVRQVSGHTAQMARDMGLKSIAVPLPPETQDDWAQAAVEASLLSLYKFKQHKTKGEDDDEADKNLESLTLLVGSDIEKSSLERLVSKGQTIANGTILARDLSNQPSNHLTPTLLAEKAEDGCRKSRT